MNIPTPTFPKKRFADGLCYLAPFFIGVALGGGHLTAQTLPLTENLIDFSSEEGQTLFLDSDARADYWALSPYFESQINLAYCGVASMVMVLNSMDIEPPIAPEYGEFRVFTQENVFDNPATEAVISKEVVARQGMTLYELGQLLASYGLQVEVVHAAETTMEDFRERAIANLNEPDNYILVNYLRREIGQETGGHISPLAAYDAESDRFLILDVARYKYPPVWVTTEDLWRSMNTVDSTSTLTRGFVLISPEETVSDE
jgi:hypothetical protein